MVSDQIIWISSLIKYRGQLLCLCVLFLSVGLPAQNNKTYSNVALERLAESDSLETILYVLQTEKNTAIPRPIFSKLAHRLLFLARSQSQSKASYVALSKLLLISNYSQDLDSSYHYFQQIRHLYASDSRIVDPSDWYYLQGTYHQVLQQYDSSAYYITRAIDAYQQEGEDTAIKQAEAYRLLGLISNRASRTATATSMGYLHKALQICTDEVDAMLRSSILLSIAVQQGMQMQHDSAYYYIQILLDRGHRMKQMNTLASATHMLTDYYFFTDQYEEALRWVDTVRLKYWEHLSPSQRNNALFTRSEALYETGQHKEAFRIGGDLLEQAFLQKSQFLIRDVAAYLARAYASQKNYDQALKHLRLNILYKDSLFNSRQAAAVSLLEKKFELANKERQLAETQNQQAEVQLSFRRNLLMGGVGAMGLLLLGTYYFWQHRMKQISVEKEATDLEQRLLRSQLNPNFAFNILGSIQRSLRNTAEPEQAAYHLVKFSKIMRQILNQSRVPEITLTDELDTINNYLSLQKLRYGHRFDYQLNIADELEPDNTLVPPMLIQPWLEQAIEVGQIYAQSTGQILIALKNPENILEIQIRDNGLERIHTLDEPGLSSIKIVTDRMQNLSRQSGAAYTYEIVHNTEGEHLVVIRLPINL